MKQQLDHCSSISRNVCTAWCHCVVGLVEMYVQHGVHGNTSDMATRLTRSITSHTW